MGPRPIQEGEALHGRNEEIRGLYHELQARRIVVLHAPSGAGKSSLVQAGLVPRLKQAEFDVWKPIRVNLDPAGLDGIPEDTNRYLLSALVSLEDELPEARRRSPAQLAKLGFLDYLENRPRRRAMLDRSVVLLFDQFEEILTASPRASTAKRAFFEAVGRALVNETYWALFIIREDYLAALAPYREHIPTLLANTFRLDLLGLDAAREAALELAQQGGRSFPGVDKLIGDLSLVHVQQADGSFVAEQGPYVEPVHLQVVGRRLWDAMPADALSIEAHDIDAYAQVSKSLGAYYADAVRSIADGDTAVERAIRDWIATKIIVGGIRSQVRQGKDSSAGLDNRHIRQLLDWYLVRTEQRAGANWFELSHDRLVEPILADNEAWEQANLHPLQVQAKIWEAQGRARSLVLGADALPSALAWARDNPTLLTDSEREFLQLSQSLRAEQLRQLRWRRAFTIALASVALVAVVLGGIARRMQVTAEQQREQAEEAQRQAELAHQQSDDARRQAELERERAFVSQRNAELAWQEHEHLTRELLRQMFHVALSHFIEKLAADGTISGEIEVDERWTPLLERKSRRFAAAHVVPGGGRLVVAGHEAVLSAVDDGGHSQFLDITMQWLLGDQARRSVVIVQHQPGGYERLELLQRNLSALGYEYELEVPLTELPEHASAGVLIVDNRWSPDFSAAEVEAVGAFVARGGGVLAVGAGWSWLGHEPGAGEPVPTLDNYPINGLLHAFGVRWGAATIDPEELEREDEDARLRFENRSANTVNVYSRGDRDRDEYYATLDPGEDLQILSAPTRVWVVRDKDSDHVLKEVTIEADDQVVAIGETVTIHKVTPRPKPSPASTPKPQADALPKTLSNAAMNAALVQAEQAAKICGQQHGAVMPRVKVKFEVAPSGKVVGANALAPLNGTPEGACAAQAVSKLRFPKSQFGVSKSWTLPLR